MIDDAGNEKEVGKPVGWAVPSVYHPYPYGSVGTAHPTKLTATISPG